MSSFGSLTIMRYTVAYTLRVDFVRVENNFNDLHSEHQ